MSDAFLPGSGFDTYESQDKVLMQMDGSTEAAVAVRILQQQGFAVVGAVVRLVPEQAEAAQAANATINLHVLLVIKKDCLLIWMGLLQNGETSVLILLVRKNLMSYL